MLENLISQQNIDAVRKAVENGFNQIVLDLGDVAELQHLAENFFAALSIVFRM